MNFNIDKQSFDELNLLGRFRQGSVYYIFNQVKTRGGEALLDQLFRNPLTDYQAINERTSIFKLFEDVCLEFPFDPQQVALMREYIDMAHAQGSTTVYGNILLKRLLSTLTRDERYKILIQGLQATIVTLKRCYAFVIQLSQTPGPYSKRLDVIKKIIGSPQLSKLLETDIYQDIPVKAMAVFDHLLRNKLNADIRYLMDFISELDVNISVASIARARRFTYAQALPKPANILNVTDLKHPGIDSAVGNDLVMRDQSNVLFLTGANMAGKSTWMKSIGTAMYLAHIGFPVAARSMQFSVREGIYSSINVSDNIALGYSHFYAEVVRVKNAAEATSTGRHLLLMFDELFKGTNVKDAYDGTLAVTEAFAEYENCLFIVSTHIIEVGEALKKRPNIQFSYMPTIMDGAVPKYTYRLQEGITRDRQGMLIIKNEGILELINGSRKFEKISSK